MRLPGEHLNECRECPGIDRVPLAAASTPHALRVKMVIRCPDCGETSTGEYDALVAKRFMNQHEMTGALTDLLELAGDFTPDDIINAGGAKT